MKHLCHNNFTSNLLAGQKQTTSLILLVLLFLAYRTSASICAGSSGGTKPTRMSPIIKPDPTVREKLRLLRATFLGSSVNDRAGSLPPPQKLVGSQGGSGGGGMPATSVVSFCPDQCSCNITLANQLQVVCQEYFQYDFPIATLRKDVEVLKIVPKCRKFRNPVQRTECLERRPNQLTLGPNFQYLRLLKVLIITDSGVPNIGIRTLWGLSGLRVLNLNGNHLTNVVDKNFDGLYSLKELYLDRNWIKSLVSAAFRHVNQLEILSLRGNRIEGKARTNTPTEQVHNL